MEMLLTNVNWVAVIVGAVIAYVVGALWYSEKLFANKWKQGIGTPAVPNTPMAYGLSAQAVGTFLLSWTVGVVLVNNSLALVILIALTIATLIKSNGFFAGKTRYAIFVETSFIFVMIAIMVLSHMVLA